MFLAREFFLEEPPKFLDLIFKTQPTAKHGAKLCGDWPTELQDTWQNKYINKL